MPPALSRLKRRDEFLAAARDGRKVPGEAFALQIRRRDDALAVRVGFTMTRRLGGAVVRNRARRRLREAARAVLAASPARGFDIVILGRPGALTARFADLVGGLRAALARGGVA